MAIKLAGEFTTSRTPQEVYGLLSDPGKFGPLIPDFQSMTQEDPTHFTVNVNVAVAHIRGTAELRMELLEAIPAARALYYGQGTAAGSQITLQTSFDLSSSGQLTTVTWQGEADIVGKLATMAGPMMEPIVRKNVQRLIDGVRNALWSPFVVPRTETQETMPGTPALPTLQAQECGETGLAVEQASRPPDSDQEAQQPDAAPTGKIIGPNHQVLPQPAPKD
jgi:carbon monoxide dehydrogenase subunit G